ncbi:MAG: T9SS type A sorting domain-containing protein [Candidatus Aegiribacteria sp.]|nr:T9SS type A sorting domain-containing protein [Candidatus Aegiribacteria sp.]
MRKEKCIIIAVLALSSQSLFALNDMGVGGSYDGFSMNATGVINLGNLTSIDPEIIEFSSLLEPAYPNPFNLTTTISYLLPQAADVNLAVYNILGRKICTLMNSRVESGLHQVVWDGCDNAGNKVPGGVYYYRLEAGDYQGVQRVILTRG